MKTKIFRNRLHRLKKQITQILGIGIAVFIFSSIACIGFAQEDKEKEEKGKIKTTTEMKEIEEQMGGITKRSISIIYARDEEKGVEYEILLPFAKEGIKLQRKRNLAEIAQGDIVKVQYEEIIEEDEQGNKKEDRKAKVISFIKPAQKRTQTLVSEEETLPLKGIR